MATRMTDTDQTTGTMRSDRPRIWPWILLAAVVALALWWASAGNRTVNDTNYNNSTTPFNATPGIGGANTGAGGVGTPGTGDVGGVGTPSPSPTAPIGPGAP